MHDLAYVAQDLIAFDFVSARCEQNQLLSFHHFRTIDLLSLHTRWLLSLGLLRRGVWKHGLGNCKSFQHSGCRRTDGHSSADLASSASRGPASPARPTTASRSRRFRW